MVLQFKDHKRDVSLLESAAYTACRRQIENRGWSGNLDVGLVTVVDTLSPEQLEQSKVSKFKPALGVVLGGAGVSPSLEVHQAKWTKKAMGQVAARARRAKAWLSSFRESRAERDHSRRG